jgi:hypothetical protein
MIEYDVILNGEIKETIKPINQRLKDMVKFVTEQFHVMKLKYGENVMIHRRIVY